MDIPALSVSLSSIQTNNDIGVAVLAKSLDMMDVQGDSLKKMMELSVNPNVGQNIDFSV
ncbi:MAG: YjfB family protein [Bacteroides sp.]|nr:YjfB family protein [Clostridia bacterium]